MFLWRFTHNSFPIQTKLVRNGVKLVDTRCPVCLGFDEDCGHLFFKCKLVKELWRLLDLEELRQNLAGMDSALEATSYILAQQGEFRTRAVVLLWCWWSAKNRANQGGRFGTIAEIHNNILYHMTEMGKLGAKVIIHKNAARNMHCPWSPPMENVYKINCDGAFVKETRKGGWGCVIRNHDSEFLVGSAGHLGHISSALQAEAFACMKGLRTSCKAWDAACDPRD
jgi:hypothetical protein